MTDAKITFKKVSAPFIAGNRYQVFSNGQLIGLVQNEKSGPYNNWFVHSTVVGRIARSCDGTAGQPGTIANVAHSTRESAAHDLVVANSSVAK